MQDPGSNHRIQTHRMAGVLFALLPIAIVGFLLRLVLALQSWINLDDGLAVFAAFGWGFFADLTYAAYAIIPLVIYLALVPQVVFRNRAHQTVMWLLFLTIWWTALVSSIADWLFWGEFGFRPNVIAVEYLFFGGGAVEDIVESYPLATILTLLAAAALLANAFMTGAFPLYQRWLQSSTPVRSRYTAAAALLAVPFLATVGISQTSMPEFSNICLQEIAKNGPYSFISELRSTKIDYRKIRQHSNTVDTASLHDKSMEKSKSRIGSGTGYLVAGPAFADVREWQPNFARITIGNAGGDFPETADRQEDRKSVRYCATPGPVELLQ